MDDHPPGKARPFSNIAVNFCAVVGRKTDVLLCKKLSLILIYQTNRINSLGKNVFFGGGGGVSNLPRKTAVDVQIYYMKGRFGCFVTFGAFTKSVDF